MKYQKAITIAAGIFAVFLVIGLLVPMVPAPRFGSTLRGQQTRSDMQVRLLASSLIAYAGDHCDTLPKSFADFSEEDFAKYYLAEALYATGTHVRSFVPSDLPDSPSAAEKFSHHSYLITDDHRHLLVYERTGLWEDHTVSYLDTKLSGKWAETQAKDAFEVTRVTEQQFAQHVSDLAHQSPDHSPANDLVAAAESGDAQKIAALLAQGTSLDAEGQGGWRALTIAAQYNQPAIASLLLDRRANVDLMDDFGLGRTALMRACALNHVDVVDILLAHHAAVRVKRDDGNCALTDALPYPAIVLKLITAGADGNEQTRKEWSPLIAACSEGYADSARLLIEHGADLKRDGPYALDAAATNGHGEVIKTLLAEGLTADKSLLGQCLISAYAYPEAMKELLAAGADLNARCKCASGRTTLMISGLNSCPKAVDLLLASGADVNAKDDNGHTVLDLMLADTRPEWLPRNSFEKNQLLGIIDTLRKAGAKESGLYVEWPEPR